MYNFVFVFDLSVLSSLLLFFFEGNLIPTIFIGKFILRLHLPMFTSTSGKIEVILLLFLDGKFLLSFFLGLLQLTHDFLFINFFSVIW